MRSNAGRGSANLPSALITGTLPNMAEPSPSGLGRGKSRSRQLIHTVATGIVARIIQTGLALIMVPVLLNYLGKERYGLWETLISLVALLGLVAQGIGNGLVQRLAEADGRDNREEMAATVSSSAALLLTASLAAIMIFAVAHFLVDWGDILGLKTVVARHDAAPAIVCVVAVFAFNLTFSFIPRTQYGLQDGHIAAGWQIIGSVLAVITVLVAIKLDAGLAGVAVSMLGVPGLVIVGGGIVYVRNRPHLLPRVRQASWKSLKQILAIGWLSFLFQAIQTISLKLDNVLVLGFLSAEAVIDLSVPMRLFILVQTVNTLLISALWPAYGEAIARGDVAWVRQTYGRALRLVLPIAVVAAVLLPIVGGKVIHLWVGGVVAPSRYLLAGIGALSLVMTCGGMVTSLLNGASLFRVQVVMAIAMFATALPLKIILLRQVGIAALPWVMTLTYAVCYLFPALYYARRYILSEET